jgi:hypothetical protein
MTLNLRRTGTCLASKRCREGSRNIKSYSLKGSKGNKYLDYRMLKVRNKDCVVYEDNTF